MNFSDAMFYENYSTSDISFDFSRHVCLLVKMASKTVIRPIDRGLLPLRYIFFPVSNMAAGWILYLIPDKCSEDENQAYVT